MASKTSLYILLAHFPQQDTTSIWPPTHAGHAGNGGGSRQRPIIHYPGTGRAKLCFYNGTICCVSSPPDISRLCNHCSLGLLTLLPLMMKFPRRCEVLWRQLQTHTFPCLYPLHLTYHLFSRPPPVSITLREKQILIKI